MKQDGGFGGKNVCIIGSIQAQHGRCDAGAVSQVHGGAEGDCSVFVGDFGGKRVSLTIEQTGKASDVDGDRVASEAWLHNKLHRRVQDHNLGCTVVKNQINHVARAEVACEGDGGGVRLIDVVTDQREQGVCALKVSADCGNSRTVTCIAAVDLTQELCVQRSRRKRIALQRHNVDHGFFVVSA